MISWCVAHTQPLKELVAKQHLLDQGYEVYMLRFKKICRNARKVEEKLAPLFPLYIFVGMDLEVAAWRSVNGTRGVSHLLMSDTTLKPAKLAPSVIAELRAQEIAEGISAGCKSFNVYKRRKAAHLGRGICRSSGNFRIDG